jgi:hypothetical protein
VVKACVAVVMVLVFARSASADEAKKSCVPDEIEQLRPAVVPDKMRAAYQDDSCKVVLDGKAKCNGGDSKATATEKQLVNDVAAYCGDIKNWLDLTAPAITEDKLDEARQLAGANSCTLAPQGGLTVQSMVPGIGLAFQDAVIRGLAGFIATRAKAEAMAFLVEKLTKSICADVDGKGLFPSTCALLGNVKADSAPMAWGTLKAAFETDIDQLPERAVACIATKITGGGTKGDVLVAGVQMAKLIHEGEDPILVVAGLQERFPMAAISYDAAGVVVPTTEPTCTKDKLGCFMHMLGYGAALLTPNVDGGKFVAPNARSSAIAARRMFDYAYTRGVVSKTQHDALAAATAEAKAKAKEMFDTLEAKLAIVKREVRRVGEHAARVRTTLENLSKGGNGGGLELLAQLAGDVANLSQMIVKVIPDELFVEPAQAHASLELLGVPMTLASTKNKATPPAPPPVESNASKLKTALAIYDEIAKAYAAAKQRDYARTFVHVSEVARLVLRPDQDAKWPSSITKYGPFIAEVASAKTAEDVQRALEAAAAPVGGGLAKRGSGRRTMAITAFLGGHVGGEVVEVDNTTDVALQGALFAPVGFDVSWGVGDSVSLGVFGSVFDLGALTSFRESKDVMVDGEMATIESAPQIGFRQVLSPGLFFVVGVDRIAFGFGASMTPRLRAVDDDGTLVDEVPALRFGGFLAFDVTLFPF